MHCVYCGVDYDDNETCLCLPPVRAGKLETDQRPECAWGEADLRWSVRDHAVTVAPFVNLV